MKADIELVQQVLREREDIDPKTAEEVVKQLMVALKNAKEEEAAAKEPPVKKQFVVVVSDPLGQIKTDLIGWVCQIEEGQSPATVIDRLAVARRDYARTKAGRRKLRDTTVGEAMEVVPARCTKESGLWVKTREPVLVITTDNQLPLKGEADSVENRPGASEQSELPGVESEQWELATSPSRQLPPKMQEFFKGLQEGILSEPGKPGTQCTVSFRGRSVTVEYDAQGQPQVVSGAAGPDPEDDVVWDDDLPLDPPGTPVRALSQSEAETPPLPPEALACCEKARVVCDGQPPGWVDDIWNEACREYALGDDLPRRRLERFRHLFALRLERSA
jgi:hypothetical protein